MIAIIAALKAEIAEYLSSEGFRPAGRAAGVRHYTSPVVRHVVVAEGGIGRRSIEEATLKTLEEFEPEVVVSAGFAAGVEPGLETGDLLLCDQVRSVTGPRGSWSPRGARCLSTDAGLWHNGLASTERPSFRRVACLTLPEVVRGSSDKRWVGERFQASIIDMESFWVVEVARRRRVRTIVVKAVLDPVEQSMPSLVERVAAGGGIVGYRGAALHALSRPTELPGLVKLWGQARTAGASLAGAMRTLASSDIPVHTA